MKHLLMTVAAIAALALTGAIVDWAAGSWTWTLTVLGCLGVLTAMAALDPQRNR